MQQKPAAEYMTMGRFADLAKRCGACGIGMAYLKAWRNEHGNKGVTVDQFFLDHKTPTADPEHILIWKKAARNYYGPTKPTIYSDSDIKYVINGYLRWILWNMVNWDDITPEYAPIGDWMTKNYHLPNNWIWNDARKDSQRTMKIVLEALLNSFKGEL